MMGARRKISERRLLTGSYGEYSSKSLPARETNDCQQYVIDIVMWAMLFDCLKHYDMNYTEGVTG